MCLWEEKKEVQQESEINRGRGCGCESMGTFGGRNEGGRTGKDVRKREDVDLQMFPWVRNKSSLSVKRSCMSTELLESGCFSFVLCCSSRASEHQVHILVYCKRNIKLHPNFNLRDS